MLTPTGVTASAYWNAIKVGNPTHLRMTFTGQNIVLDDSDINISRGFTVNDILNGDTDLIFGKAVSKQITTSILNSSKLDGLVWTGEFTLEMGVEIGNPAVTYWVTLGLFSGEKPNNVTTVKEISFTAYDRMKRFDVVADDFVNAISYPTTIQDIYDNLCSYVGLQNVSGDEIHNIMTRSYAIAPVDMQGYTCRDILTWIAQSCGCYAKINADGNVQMVWFTDNTAHNVTEREEFKVDSGDINDGMPWDEADTFLWDDIEKMTWDDICGYQEAYCIDRILVKQIDNEIDINYPSYQTDGNTYIIINNPFLSVSSYADVQNYIIPLYDRMVNFGGYLPFKMNCVGSWCVEAGDVITISVGSNTITVPIFVKSMKWNGSVNDSYETTGQKNRSAFTSEGYKQKVLNSKEIKFYVEDNFYGKKSGITIEQEGVTINGGRFIKLNSGSELDIESGSNAYIKSGGNFNINSGGNVNIKSGGKLNVESGGDLDLLSGSNINLKSGGNLNVESGGNFTVNSGGNIDVKSGGSFKLSSGSTINIKASGTLQLTGSSVYISSNSIFDLRSTNMEIDSNNGLVNVNGSFLVNKYISSSVGNYTLAVGDPYSIGYSIVADLYSILGTGRLYKSGSSDVAYPTKLSIYDKKTENGYEKRTDFYFGEYWYGNDQILCQGLSIEGSKRNISNNNTENVSPTLAVSNGRFVNIYVSTVYYTTLIQNSSKDIKHDIQPIASIGDKLDALIPVTFIYDNDENEKQRMGLIYEDTIDIMPEICTDDESNKAINYVELIPALLKEIQDLRKRVSELERGE